MNWITLFWLLVAHALCDYPLQGDFLAAAKNHKSGIAGVPWYQALTAHSLIHAGAVALITGSYALAMMEFVGHWCIDRTKCDGTTTFDQDQWLHVTCKVLWVLMLPLVQF